MKYSGRINYVKAAEWQLSPALCVLFDWMYDVPSWADHVIFGSDVYYFASRNKAIEDLVILTDKPDTMYRYYVQLRDKDLIEIKKIDGKDYIRLTAKAKQWDFISHPKTEVNSEKNHDTRKKIRENSEKNPSELGKISESNSEKNPTYYSISIDKDIRDKDINDKLVFIKDIGTNDKSFVRECDVVNGIVMDSQSTRSKAKRSKAYSCSATYKDFIDIWRQVDVENNFDFSVNKNVNVGQAMNIMKAIGRDLEKKYGSYDRDKMLESIEAVLQLAYKYFKHLYDKKVVSVSLFEPTYVYKHYQKIKSFRPDGISSSKLNQLFHERYSQV